MAIGGWTPPAINRVARLLQVEPEEAATLDRTFVERVLAAVQAALDLPWSTSPVEGQISRLKTIKRTMYGRAGFDLLRCRVLHAM